MRRAALACAWLAAVLSAPAARADDVETVRRCLATNAPERSSRYRLGFSSRDADGQLAEQRAEVYWRRFPEGERRVLLRLEAPEKVAGSALLAIVKPDTLPEIHLYLPELGRPQRIHHVEQLRGFLGRSGVELAELWRIVEATPELAARLVDANASLAGRRAWAVEADFEIPRQQGSERVRSLVDQATCVLLQMERFDARGKARRRLEVDPARIEPVGERWLPRALAFIDLQGGTTARVEVLSVEIDSELPAGLLTKKALERERER